ncbi:hypothetical protein KI809_02195 [Geobacter pelophilus]|uniref:Uncharacterized protein n=1 Tax=Geoanaerobacter pelophilus TaxID=60036 RepID=A0AAW4L4X3_9BACT|nr:hypothetical protein [Geoanaerobacter pelophilus]
MRSRIHRIISLIVLLAVVSMVTGLGSIAQAAQAVKSEKCSCDDGKQKDGEQCPEDEGQQCPTPCDSSFCPIFTCMVADIPSPIALLVTPLQDVPFFTFTPTYIPDPFITPIFHPPSLA